MGLTIDHIDIVTHQYYHIWDTIDVDNTSVTCNKQFIWYVPTQPSNCQDRLPGVELHPMDYADWTYSPSHSIDHCAWLSRRSLYVHLAVWHTSLFGCQMPNPKSFPSSKRGSKGVSAKDWELCITEWSQNRHYFGMKTITSFFHLSYHPYHVSYTNKADYHEYNEIEVDLCFVSIQSYAYSLW